MKIRIGNKKNWDKGEYVGRPSPLGNPFPMSDDMDREECIEKYRDWIRVMLDLNDKAVLNELSRLATILYKEKELTLLCWCAPKRCHAEVIKEVLIDWLKIGITDEDVSRNTGPEQSST